MIAWSDECEDQIDALKLQKLLYYAQGHYLADYDEPLFGDQIKAWVHGPVVPGVWREYRQFGASNINVDVIGDDFNWDDYEEVNSFLVSIYNTYGQYAGWTLRNMTHREAPWRDSFDGRDSSNTIPLADMKNYFAALG